MSRALHVLFLALVAAAIAQAFWQHDRLPEQVASHFNAAGVANGWMTRDSQTAAHTGIVLFLTAMFEGLAWIGPRLPAELVNLPHRDYWLAPERRAATHAWLGGTVWLLGCGLMVFILALFQQVYRANLAAAPMRTAPAGLIFGGLLFTAGLVLAGMFLRFARPPAA